MESAQEYQPVNSSVSSDLCVLFGFVLTFTGVGVCRYLYLGQGEGYIPRQSHIHMPIVVSRLLKHAHIPRRQPQRQGQKNEGQVVDGHTVQVHRRIGIRIRIHRVRPSLFFARCASSSSRHCRCRRQSLLAGAGVGGGAAACVFVFFFFSLLLFVLLLQQPREHQGGKAVSAPVFEGVWLWLCWVE